ncbi:MAG: peptidoglycan editing factor PgeF [Spirochaetota bacterium]|nr:peptidoglycan editing factor PgeF [Spirochaetota bacterium]
MEGIHSNVIEKKGNIIAGTTYRSINNIDFNLSFKSGDSSKCIKNRKLLFETIFSSIENGVFVQQVHGNNIAIVSLKDKGLGSINDYDAIVGCDAIITKEKNLILCIQTADCLPIFIYDSVKHAIALIHAGWRGTAKEITFNSIKTLSSSFNSDPKDFVLSFGPGIHSCCYEVSKDFKDIFSSEFLYNRENRLFLNLINVNKVQAINAGVLEDNIYTESSLCTACYNNKFFSYRMERENSGRMISYFALK